MRGRMSLLAAAALAVAGAFGGGVIAPQGFNAAPAKRPRSTANPAGGGYSRGSGPSHAQAKRLARKRRNVLRNRRAQRKAAK